MKIKITVLILFLLCTASVYAQTTEEVYNKKITTEAEFERIYGKILGQRLNKTTGDMREIKDIIIKGNKIQTVLFNYGSVTAPGAQADIKDLVWNGLGYGYEFGLMAGSKVINAEGDTINIISDSHVSSREGDYNADRSLKWGWLPKAGYSAVNQNRVASLNAQDLDSDGKPDSWPEAWYSPGAGKYLWPAFLGDASTAPDEEVYYAIDDYTNYEFISDYQPFNNDDSKAGLGLDTDVRILQFNNPLAEDLIFMVYQMTNASDKDLNNFYMGMFGDPHIGGVGDVNDDMASFIPPSGDLADMRDQRARSMVYGWDQDFVGRGGKRPGFFGWKFLESPSIDDDQLDNDDDGILNESPFNSRGEFIDGSINPLDFGILDVEKYTNVFGKPKARWSGDEDGDWNPEKNDIGIDGIGPESANYPGKDYGEGDGFPSQAWYDDLNNNGLYDTDEVGTLTDEWSLGKKWAGSEPNFGFRDISESDQLGLTGFTVAAWADPSNTPKNDDRMMDWFTKPEIRSDQELLQTAGDNVFSFSTGPMDLEKGESQRFSMVILFGEDVPDLLLNAITSVRILEADYQFAQPPDKPIVTAVGGDERVTLYWDAKSEKSIDPLTSEEDFEGYKIYRSRDFNFSDVYKITDANGIPFLGQALFDINTGEPAQFDLDNEYSGLAGIEYVGRGVKYNLGSNTGLVHEYVDSTVQNGVEYYYAVVAYDRGTDELPPTETQSVIQEDPETGNLLFDVNTLSITPGPIAAGIKESEVGIGNRPTLTAGNSTGNITLKVLEELAVQNKTYKVKFDSSNSYNVLDSTGVEYTFISKGTTLVALRHKNIVSNSVIVKDQNDVVVPISDYVVNGVRGQIASSSNTTLPATNEYKISYRYYPVFESSLIQNEDGNEVFDGIRVFVQEDELGLDQVNSRFLNNLDISVIDTSFFPPVLGGDKIPLRTDWEVRWNNTDVAADGTWLHADTMSTLLGNIAAPFTIWNITRKEPGIFIEEPATFVYYEPNIETQGNGQWDWGEGLILQPQGAADATVSYQLSFDIDTTVSSPTLPQAGDVYQLITRKPFEIGDEFVFDTKEVEFIKTSTNESLDNIYVVPNPYVAFSANEKPGRTHVKRGERELQFRNLPPQCTIRIYTLTGELVDEVIKDDNGSIAYWNLLSSEGMRIAYGVYIYHIDLDGAGEKIGRFAVIK